MPSRKQRRRRAKEQRHEWEYVEIDPETGEERPVEAAAPKPQKDDKGAKKPVSGRRPVRPVPPPSWSRTARRAAPWAALLVLVMLFVGQGAPIGDRIFYGLVYGAFLFPFLYWMDRIAYRMYLRRSGQAPPPRGAKDNAKDK